MTEWTRNADRRSFLAVVAGLSAITAGQGALIARYSDSLLPDTAALVFGATTAISLLARTAMRPATGRIPNDVAGMPGSQQIPGWDQDAGPTRSPGR